MLDRVHRDAALLALVLVGCFEDPPPSIDSGTMSESTGETIGTSTSATSVADTTSTTSTDPDTTTSSTTSVDPDTTAESTGERCASVTPPLVPADIVAAFGPSIDPAAQFVPWTSLFVADDNQSAALGSPPQVGAPMFEPSCSMGCRGCRDRALVAVSIDVPPIDALLQTTEFDCVWRPTDNPVSRAVRHVWIVDQVLPPNPPPAFAKALNEGDRARLHLACPDCGRGSTAPGNGWTTLVDESGGSIVDLDVGEDVEDQARGFAAPRYACAWPDIEVTESIEIRNESGDVFEIGRVESCDDEGPMGTESGAFIEGAAGVMLCPRTCFATQATRASALDVRVCEP